MHGPYIARIKIRRSDGNVEIVDVPEDELAREREIVRQAGRFYSRVGGTTLYDVETLGVFYAAALLDSGDEAEVAALGYVGASDHYARRDADGRVEARVNRVSRDENGRMKTTLGSRFNERVFVGV